MQWPEQGKFRILLATVILLGSTAHAGHHGTSGASAGEPSSFAPRQALSQALNNNLSDTASHRADQNWQYFWDHHLGEWKGRWTRYSPDGTVVETFRSSRDFRADPAHTHVHQVNRYRYQDGRTVEKSWSFNRAEHSQPDGFSHPASAKMRGLAFRTGAAAWLVPALAADEAVPMELFLMDGKVRHSVGLVYGKDRKLLRTASIREDQRGYPGPLWSEEIAQESPWQLAGSWEGISEVIGADLSRSTQQASQITWPSTANREIYFPDRIVLSCPEHLPLGQPFSVAVRWLAGDGSLQIIRADYDQRARLDKVQHQLLRRAPGSGA